MLTFVQRLNVRQIEDGLSRLRGVHAVRVMLNDAGDDVEEIHVLASRSRNPKQIVRDIESLLFVQFHTRIDYRRVSLVQMSAQDLPSYFKRPKLVSVKQDTGNGVLAVEVCLVHADGVEAVGRAQVQPDAPDVCYVAALATIQAVSGLISNVNRLMLRRAQVAPFGGQSLALVYLSWQTTHGEESLLGAALVETDVVHSIVRATLDAVNRRLF